MYKFVDTIEAPGAEEMPAEAMKINGEYIENLMDSRYCTYRTLYTEGRETLSPETSSFTTGVRDGSSLLSKRYPERVITVGYKLQAISDYWFRIAYNELMKILNVENAELIFYDEQDKYYIGTPTGMKDGDSGTNFVQGEITITCHDPFKYSITEYEAEPTEDGGSTFVVEYNGTYKGYPTMYATFGTENDCGDDGETPTELTGKPDCGYVAWYNENAKVIQLGDPQEEDAEEYDKSQTLTSQSFKNVPGWSDALNAIWSKNTGTSYAIDDMNGTPGFAPALAEATANYLTATNIGSGSKWHGACVTRDIPADAVGDVGATDWTLWWSQKMNIGDSSDANKRCGCIEVMVSDANGKIIAGANMHKGPDDSGSKGKVWAHVNGSVVKKDNSVDYSYHNTRWGTNGGGVTSVKSNTITKSGSTVTMNLGGVTWSFTDSNIKNMVARKITITFATWGTYTVFPWMGVYEVKFTKNNCETWQDIPNKFGANDTATAVCRDGEVLVNDCPCPDYGALGNDWEEFYLSPGYNQIGFSYSYWCENPPTTRMTYREVYL